MMKKAYLTMLKFFEKYYWIFFIAASLVLAFYCFRCLDIKYVASWDEARHGVNAYEMLQNKDFIRHTYNYAVDDWNLKPSVSYWAIILGFKLFGYNVFGMRFFSALAYLITGIACALFAKRFSKTASIVVLGFFCANELPLAVHMARAGDADSLYVMFFTLAMLFMLRVKENHKRLYACGLFFALAFLTKSWHAGMIAAIGGLYLLTTGELFRLKLKEWGGFLLSAFVPVFLWFGWRFTKDGFFFLNKMIEVDLLARTGTDNFEGHSYPFSYYFDGVFGNQTYIYSWLVGICLIGLIFAVVRMWKRNDWNRDHLATGLGFLLWFFIPFLGFSVISTKLIWYCYPAIIPILLLAAIFIGKVLELPVSSKGNGNLTAMLSIAAAAGGIILTAYFMKESYFHTIREIHGDGFQLFIQESIERDSEYAGKKAYIYVPGEDPEEIGNWDQNVLFLAEISGNFHCIDGGLDGFLSEEEPAVLYLTTGQYSEFKEQLTDKLVLYENAHYILLANH